MLELCLIAFDGEPPISCVDYHTAIKVLKQNNPLEKKRIYIGEGDDKRAAEGFI